MVIPVMLLEPGLENVFPPIQNVSPALPQGGESSSNSLHGQFNNRLTHVGHVTLTALNDIMTLQSLNPGDSTPRVIAEGAFRMRAEMFPTT